MGLVVWRSCLLAVYPRDLRDPILFFSMFPLGFCYVYGDGISRSSNKPVTRLVLDVFRETKRHRESPKVMVLMFECDLLTIIEGHTLQAKATGSCDSELSSSLV